MPLLGHFALDDAFFPISTVDELEKKLKAGGVKFEFHRYKAAPAFAHEGGPNYNRDAVELAWQRTMAFFEKTLRV
jgi:carboxymethylenebutenolidase